MIDYYAILGVARNATQIQIRDAYLKLARETHPDKVKDQQARKKAEDAFKYVTAAYDTLSRERSRRDYTSRLPPEAPAKTSAPPAAKGAAAPSPPPAPAPKSAAAATIATTGRVNFDALAQGIEAFKKQDFHTAVQLLNLAVSQDDKSARAHGMLAMALAKNPNWVRDALNHMETAVKLDPKNVSYHVEMALMLHAQGLKLRARRTMEAAAALNPEHPDVARGLQTIPLTPGEGESPEGNTSETSRGLFDRLRKR